MEICMWHVERAKSEKKQQKYKIKVVVCGAQKPASFQLHDVAGADFIPLVNNDTSWRERN